MTKYLKIKQLFEKHRNPEKAKQEARYMRYQFSFYGLQTPERRALYKDFLKNEKKSKKIDWAFLDKCYEDEYREFQYLANDYLIAMAKYLSYNDVPKLFKYIKTKQWWDTIDKLDRIVGNIGLTDSRIDDVELLEKIIVNNLGSDEFFINKAIGWSLRDYSKTNPQWVRDFIKKHQDKMHKLSIKEAGKYI